MCSILSHLRSPSHYPREMTFAEKFAAEVSNLHCSGPPSPPPPLPMEEMEFSNPSEEEVEETEDHCNVSC